MLVVNGIGGCNVFGGQSLGRGSGSGRRRRQQQQRTRGSSFEAPKKAMPAQEQYLGNDKVHLLAAYVLNLSQEAKRTE